MKFPAITVCNVNPIRRSVYQFNTQFKEKLEERDNDTCFVEGKIYFNSRNYFEPFYVKTQLSCLTKDMVRVATMCMSYTHRITYYSYKRINTSKIKLNQIKLNQKLLYMVSSRIIRENMHRRSKNCQMYNQHSAQLRSHYKLYFNVLYFIMI